MTLNSGVWSSSAAAANLSVINAGATGSSIPILLTNATIGVNGQPTMAMGFTLSGGIVLQVAGGVTDYRQNLAHELGHLGGYSVGNPNDPYHSSASLTNLMNATATPATLFPDQDWFNAIINLLPPPT
jgi:hypothetical protein